MDIDALVAELGGVPVDESVPEPEAGPGFLDRVRGAGLGALDTVQGPRVGAAIGTVDEFLNPGKEGFLDFGAAGGTYDRLLKDNFQKVTEAQERTPGEFMAGQLGSAFIPVGGALAGIGAAAKGAKALSLGSKGTLAAKAVGGGIGGAAETALMVQTDRQRRGEADSLTDLKGFDGKGLTTFGGVLGSASPLLGAAIKGTTSHVRPVSKRVGEAAKEAVSQRALGLSARDADRLAQRSAQIDSAPAWGDIVTRARETLDSLQTQISKGSGAAFDALRGGTRIDATAVRKSLQSFVQRMGVDTPGAAAEATRMIKSLDSRNLNSGMISKLQKQLSELPQDSKAISQYLNDPKALASNLEQRAALQQRIAELSNRVELDPVAAKTWFQNVVDPIAYNLGRDTGFLEPVQKLAQRVRGTIDAQLKGNQEYTRIMRDVAADTEAYGAAKALLKGEESTVMGKFASYGRSPEKHRSQLERIEELARRMKDSGLSDSIIDRRVADTLEAFKPNGSRMVNAGAAAGTGIGFMVGNPIIGGFIGAGVGFLADSRGRQWARSFNEIVNKYGPGTAAKIERATAEIGKAVERGGPQAGRAMVALLAKSSPEVAKVMEETDRHAGTYAALQAAPYKGPSRNDPPPEINAAITHHMRMANDPTYRRKHQVKAGR